MEMNYSEVMYRVNCMASDLNSLYHQAALKLGMSDTVLFLLYLVYENDGSCLIKDIQQETQISKQTLNSAIRKLEKEDIIYLEQSGGRAKIVCLTQKGKEYTDHTIARLFQAEREAFKGWTQEEIDQYLALMERYNNQFRLQIDRM